MPNQALKQKLILSSGSQEGLKWLALLAMTCDHANRFLLKDSSHLAFAFGRLAMPLFAFLFAYNLAKPALTNKASYHKLLKRLVLFGVLAMPAFMMMKGLSYPWPLNILFSFALSLGCLYYVEFAGQAGRLLALSIFLLGGFLVEYDWVGLLFFLSCYFFCKNASWSALLSLALAYYLLDIQNGNAWALATIPLILLAHCLDLKLPRIKHFFYFYYPLHLYLLALLSKIGFSL